MSTPLERLREASARWLQEFRSAEFGSVEKKVLRVVRSFSQCFVCGVVQLDGKERGQILVQWRESGDDEFRWES